MPLEKPSQEPTWTPGSDSSGQGAFGCDVLGQFLGCPILLIGLGLGIWWYLR